ncbi:MAG: hypothetical protein AAF081_08265 [Actinomycetota bacterium]
MIKGEYKGASLGWLAALLVAVGVWAAFFGPDDFEITNNCRRADANAALIGTYPTWPAGATNGAEGATYPVTAPDGGAAFALCITSSSDAIVVDIMLGDPVETLAVTRLNQPVGKINSWPIGPDEPALVVDLFALADHCSAGWTASEAEVEILRDGRSEVHPVGLGGTWIFSPDGGLCQS